MAVQRKSAVKIEVSASDIAWIKENISSMSLKIQEVNISLLKLNQTVIGDKTYGQTGLIEKVEEHNAYIEKDKQFKSKLVGGGLVLAFIWGLILSINPSFNLDRAVEFSPTTEPRAWAPIVTVVAKALVNSVLIP